MKPRHAAAFALVGWYLVMPGSVLAASVKPKWSIYTNQTYGFSLQYPNDWILKEGKEAHLTWGYLGPVAVNESSVTVAAVEMPVSYYPDSDVQMAFMIVTVDAAHSAANCTEGSPKERVGPTEFAKGDSDGQASMSHGYYIKSYLVVRNRICFDFGLGEGTFTGDPDAKHVDYHSVFRRLRAVLAAVKFSPPKIASQGKAE